MRYLAIALAACLCIAAVYVAPIGKTNKSHACSCGLSCTCTPDSHCGCLGDKPSSCCKK